MIGLKKRLGETQIADDDKTHLRDCSADFLALGAASFVALDGVMLTLELHHGELADWGRLVDDLPFVSGAGREWVSGLPSIDYGKLTRHERGPWPTSSCLRSPSW